MAEKSFPGNSPKRFPRRIHRHEAVLLLLMMLFAGGIWLFIELADEVKEGETQDIDERILLAMRSPDKLSDPVGPEWFEEACRDITALGGNTVVLLITAGVAGYLWLTRRHNFIFILLAAVAGGLLLSLLLKVGFDRPRPDLVPHEAYVYTKSFPSGHSIMAAVIYLTLAGLLAYGQEQFRTKSYLFAVALALTVLVGFSRVYLGVHWPTDVLAGWTVGALWTLMVLQFGHWLHHRSRDGKKEGQL